MRQRILLWTLTCLALVSVSAWAASRGITVNARTDSGKTKQIRLYSGYEALVVGCGAYREGWPRLPNPVNDARDGYVAGEELGVYLQENVFNYSHGAQHPQFGKVNNPKLDKGDFIFLASKEIGESQYVDRTEQKPKTGCLFVETDPKGARIRILNIAPVFYQGIELALGSYHVEASLEGYETQRMWVSVDPGEDKTVDMRLTVSPKELVVLPTPARPSALAPRVSGPDKAITVSSIGYKMVYIEPGTFMMGSLYGEPKIFGKETLHRVTLTKGFYMGATEVTQGQWKKVMGSNPSKFSGDDCPVENVSWEDCQQFIQKLNQMEGTNKYRLPTEAEWEYACRAGTSTPFSFGNCLSTDQANYNGKYPLPGCAEGQYREKTVPAASFAPNAWGLYDMHGNVWELCQDSCSFNNGVVTDTYRDNVVDPVCRQGVFRVIRGGSWYDDARVCRSANRFYDSPGGRCSVRGFRLSKNL